MTIYYILSFFALALSTVCGFIFIPQILDFCKKRGLYDNPDKRKIHKNAIPRLGGVAFLPSMLVAFMIAITVFNNTSIDRISMNLWSIYFFVSLLLIYSVGIVDDLIGLNATVKFTVQIIASSLVPLAGLYFNNFYGFLGIYEIPYWIGVPLTVFVLVFITNAINLIDGIDGLSSGLAFLALTGFYMIFMREHLGLYGILIAGLMGVLIAYFYFNVFGKEELNRKIFMGDAGSLTLGFILGFLLIKFAMHNPNVMPFRMEGLLLPYTLLIVPMFDVVRVVIARIRNRKPLFSADKNHIHHKLMRAGLNQHQTLIFILLLALVFCMINAIMYVVPIDSTIIAIVDIIIYIAFHLVLDRIIGNKGKESFVNVEE